MTEIRVTSLNELQPGSMRQVRATDIDLLIARVGNEVWATSAHCVHYGAPLVEGVLHGRRLVCPWHHAVFDVATGKQLEPPGCGDLQHYPVRVENGVIWVTIEKPELAESSPKVSSTGDSRLIAVVGAGAAGTSAAVELRQQGFAGRLVLLSRDQRLPYDRTLLSKEVLQGAATPCPVELHPAAFYRDLEIELRLECEVRRLDTNAHILNLQDGATLTYDMCLLATGGQPRRLKVPGESLPQVFALRSWEDSDQLVAALSSTRHAVIVGSSFIGLECAASLRKRGIGVTVVSPEQHPFAELFGERVSAALIESHRAQGTEFVLGDQVSSFLGKGYLKAVATKNGQQIVADLAIVGVGISPATEFITDLKLAEDGGVLVDGYLQAGDDLFAAGDIAAFTLPLSGKRTRIEHWRLACEHGRLGAGNMLGRKQIYSGIPFFWSAQGMALYYVGHAEAAADVLIDGDPGNGAFIAYYAQGGRVVAALGVERNAEMAALQELARLKLLPRSDELQAFNAVARLREIFDG